MSNHALNWAKAQPIRGPRKAVLLVLADRADKHGECWPSLDTIAHDAGCAQSTAVEAVKWLEEDGWLKHKPRFHTGGLKTSNLYTLCFSRSPGDGERSPGDGGTDHRETVIGSPGDGDKPSVEPTKRIPAAASPLESAGEAAGGKPEPALTFDEFAEMFPGAVENMKEKL